ncbi:tetratricopeptide repeat protein [Rathayibacter festucae]|uniref:tetratricopeptide repeat protein n=1 Tax=Rathayibacter festucae TaxID=110937 RepID=UPI002A6B0920|nr:tetratricopeptide repeat protein [Rathayibacter festucae]MDY0914866.1 tetratricopeptide repeat protein [Rathayibacter festucae]
MDSNDELFLLGRDLEERPRAACVPEHYWEEAVWRDPGDVRCLVALARTLTDAARFDEAERHLRAAIERLTSRGARPADSEAHYRLGVLLTWQGRMDEAVEALGTARRTAAWRVPAGVALGRLHAAADRPREAEAVLREVLATEAQHARATALLATVLRRTGREEESSALLRALLERDPLDPWARDLAGRPLPDDPAVLVEVALEYRAAGLPDDALRLLALAVEAEEQAPPERIGVPAQYHAALLHEREGRTEQARTARRAARLSPLEGRRAIRLEDVEALEAAGADDTTARFLLGDWYDRKGRIEDAFAARWSVAAHDARASVRVLALRGLGDASCTAYGDPEAALAYVERARSIAPGDAELLLEYDRLRAHLGHEGRLALLEEHETVVLERDDLTLEYAELLVAAGRAGCAQRLLLGRRFEPGEGRELEGGGCEGRVREDRGLEGRVLDGRVLEGRVLEGRVLEGRVLEVWDATMIALADASSPTDALTFLCAALAPPACLGEVRPPLDGTADLLLRRGDARSRLGDDSGARDDWEAAAGLTGDAVTAPRFDAQTVSAIRALQRLGRAAEAARLAAAFAQWIEEEHRIPASGEWSRADPLFPRDPQTDKDARLAHYRAQLAALGEEGAGHAQKDACDR